MTILAETPNAVISIIEFQGKSYVKKEAKRGFEKTLQNEVEILKRLSHPNIVRVHDYKNNSAIIDYVPGTLRDVLKTRSLGINETVSLMSQVFYALEHAHARGIIH